MIVRQHLAKLIHISVLALLFCELSHLSLGEIGFDRFLHEGLARILRRIDRRGKNPASIASDMGFIVSSYVCWKSLALHQIIDPSTLSFESGSNPRPREEAKRSSPLSVTGQAAGRFLRIQHAHHHSSSCRSCSSSCSSTASNAAWGPEARQGVIIS